MHRVGDVSRVLRGDARHRDPSVAGHVHVVLVAHSLDFVGVETSEAEHPDLRSHVRPAARRAAAWELKRKIHTQNGIGSAPLPGLVL